MDICIDFDGTCVTHEFPKVGKDIGAIPILKKIIDAGNRLILFTMRSDIPDEIVDGVIISKGGYYLRDALTWFRDNDIPLYGININPSQFTWTKSNKAYGDIYIDDAAIGCPLKCNYVLSKRPFVDWEILEKELSKRGII